jgi:hypothetical protein
LKKLTNRGEPPTIDFRFTFAFGDSLLMEHTT